MISYEYEASTFKTRRDSSDGGICKCGLIPIMDAATVTFYSLKAAPLTMYQVMLKVRNLFQLVYFPCTVLQHHSASSGCTDCSLSQSPLPLMHYHDPNELKRPRKTSWPTSSPTIGSPGPQVQEKGLPQMRSCHAKLCIAVIISSPLSRRPLSASVCARGANSILKTSPHLDRRALKYFPLMSAGLHEPRRPLRGALRCSLCFSRTKST